MSTELHVFTWQGALGAANDISMMLCTSAIHSLGTDAGCMDDHNIKYLQSYLRTAFSITTGGHKNFPCFLILTPLL